MKVLQRAFGALGLYFHLSDKKMRPLLQFNLLQNSCTSKSTLSSHRGMGISTHMHTHVHVCTRMHTYVYMCTCVCRHAHAQVHVCAGVRVCTYMCRCTRVCTCVHTGAHLYACTHTHTCIVQPHSEPASPKGSHAHHSQTLLQRRWPGHQLQLRQGRAGGGSGRAWWRWKAFLQEAWTQAQPAFPAPLPKAGAVGSWAPPWGDRR